MRQYLDRTVGVHGGTCTAACLEGERTGFVRDAVRFQLLFGLSDAGDFRPRVHHVGNQVVIDVGMLPGNDLGRDHALLLSFVGEHGATHHIADSVNVTDYGLHMIVHRDASAVIGS